MSRKQRIRLNESQLRRIIKESINRVLTANVNESVEEGTPKQNAFLRKLMGDRYKPEYDDLSVQDSSNMIDQELKNSGAERKEYEVVEAIGSEPRIYPCNSFFEARKKLGEIVNDYFDNGWSCVGDVSLKQKSDICWVVVYRNSRYPQGSIYIRKKK